ncbi:MAG: hypothetical protein HYW23_00415 [Candidatus Aenigmarchaeota archaeon]|nr:hypothetical protein [Candidatus Aenigmarchaeota archaeon]
MFSDDEVEIRILLKLDKRGKWGGAHTSVDNLKKGWNIRDLGKEGSKRVDKLTRELIRRGLILSKPTSYGLEISLNPRFSHEIRALIQKYFYVGPVV